MKKLIILIVIIFSFNLSNSQCNFKIDKVDEFTGHKILETKEKWLTMSGMGFGISTTISFRKINEDRFMKFHVTTTGDIFTLKKGESLLFKTDKDEIITLNFDETIVAEGSYNTSLKMTIWAAFQYVHINDENYEKLLNSNVVLLRFHSNDGYIQKKVKQKRYKKIIEILNCI